MNSFPFAVGEVIISTKAIGIGDGCHGVYKIISLNEYSGNAMASLIDPVTGIEIGGKWAIWGTGWRVVTLPEIIAAAV